MQIELAPVVEEQDSGNFYPVDYFTPPAKRVALNCRVPETLKSGLQVLVKLWKIRAQAEKKDPEAVDLTFVVERLLMVGLDGACAEAVKIAGLRGLPQNEAEWDALTKAFAKAVQSENAKK